MSDSTALTIDENRVVSMHYQLSNGFGELIDSSQGVLPLVYMHNTNAILPGLERELTGKQAGESVDVIIYPEDGYGYADETLIQEFPKSELGAAEKLEIGMRIRASGPDDESTMATLREIRDETVVLDANHPLAGQVLHFSIAIVNVREPTEKELREQYAESTNPAPA
ncbi:MAG: peptidylprolyl isomerase [Granulosicoccus sp.]